MAIWGNDFDRRTLGIETGPDLCVSIRETESDRRDLMLAIAVGIAAYMITGICNDSSVTTAPVYWAVLGIGAAMGSDRDLSKKMDDISHEKMEGLPHEQMNRDMDITGENP